MFGIEFPFTEPNRPVTPPPPRPHTPIPDPVVSPESPPPSPKPPSVSIRTIAHIKKTIPNYTYNSNDFQYTDRGNGRVKLEYWRMELPRPTYEELELITQEELNEVENYKPAGVKIQMFEAENYILSPIEGSVAYINDVLKIYKDGKWSNQKEIQDLNVYSTVNVGTSNHNITPSEFIGGIVYGIPSGNRVWTLPSSSSIISYDPNCKIGTTYRVIFNNLGPTSRTVTIVPGTGMSFVDGVQNVSINKSTKSSIVLYFRVDDITSGSESMTIFYG